MPESVEMNSLEISALVSNWTSEYTSLSLIHVFFLFYINCLQKDTMNLFCRDNLG